MLVRMESIKDYPGIAGVNLRAFERPVEAVMVALLRQRRAFDPELSLVAELEGQVVGHALFSPYRVNLPGEAVMAVGLGPIAVDPAYQKQGVGAALIDAGHNLAREKGYAFSMLLGHPTYYPRLGYQTHAFGGAALKLATAGLPASTLLPRPPQPADVPALYRLWQAQEGPVDFALDPGIDLLDWVSPNPAVESAVYTDGAEIVGYTRVHANRPDKPDYFLARDPEAARQVAAFLAHKAGGPESIVLPLHPASPLAAGLGQAVANAWEPAMVYPLQSSPFDSYYALLKAGHRPAGRPLWPSHFDLEK